MSNDLSTVFAGIIADAAKTPKTTGATEKYAQRLNGAGTGSVILLDVSESMNQHVGTQTKITLLKRALSQTLGLYTQDRPVLLPFSSAVGKIDNLAQMPEPGGSTALHLALEYARTFSPRHTLVVSDGQPDSETAALVAADRLPGIIDVLYIGPDSDAAALAFMRKLARTGGGRFVSHDVVKQAAPAQLAQAVRGLLAAPE